MELIPRSLRLQTEGGTATTASSLITSIATLPSIAIPFAPVYFPVDPPADLRGAFAGFGHAAFFLVPIICLRNYPPEWLYAMATSNPQHYFPYGKPAEPGELGLLSLFDRDRLREWLSTPAEKFDVWPIGFNARLFSLGVRKPHITAADPDKFEQYILEGTNQQLKTYIDGLLDDRSWQHNLICASFEVLTDHVTLEFELLAADFFSGKIVQADYKDQVAAGMSLTGGRSFSISYGTAGLSQADRESLRRDPVLHVFLQDLALANCIETSILGGRFKEMKATRSPYYQEKKELYANGGSGSSNVKPRPRVGNYRIYQVIPNHSSASLSEQLTGGHFELQSVDNLTPKEIDSMMKTAMAKKAIENVPAQPDSPSEDAATPATATQKKKRKRTKKSKAGKDTANSDTPQGAVSAVTDSDPSQDADSTAAVTDSPQGGDSTATDSDLPQSADSTAADKDEAIEVPEVGNSQPLETVAPPEEEDVEEPVAAQPQEVEKTEENTVLEDDDTTPFTTVMSRKSRKGTVAKPSAIPPSVASRVLGQEKASRPRKVASRPSMSLGEWPALPSAVKKSSPLASYMTVAVQASTSRPAQLVEDKKPVGLITPGSASPACGEAKVESVDEHVTSTTAGVQSPVEGPSRSNALQADSSFGQLLARSASLNPIPGPYRAQDDAATRYGHLTVAAANNAAVLVGNAASQQIPPVTAGIVVPTHLPRSQAFHPPTGGFLTEVRKYVDSAAPVPRAVTCHHCGDINQPTEDRPIWYCPFCGPDSEYKYCSVDCLLAAALTHSQHCDLSPPTSEDLNVRVPAKHKSMANVIRSLDPTKITIFQYRQRHMHHFCYIGVFPEIVNADNKRSSLLGAGWLPYEQEYYRKVSGDYHIFRSCLTANGYYCNNEVICTIKFLAWDARRHIFTRVAHACYLTHDVRLIKFMFGVIRHWLLYEFDNEVVWKIASRDEIYHEFKAQFHAEWTIDTANPESGVVNEFEFWEEWTPELKQLLESYEARFHLLGRHHYEKLGLQL